MATAILKATDIAATIDWYTFIGFELRGRFPESGSPTWCELGRDDMTLQFLAGRTPWSEVGLRDPNGYFITFTEAVGDRS